MYRNTTPEPHRELEQQLNNKFTLLELLDVSCCLAICTFQSLIFTFNAKWELKCWSTRSTKQLNSIRVELDPKQTAAKSFFIFADNDVVIFIASRTQYSEVFRWGYRSRDNSQTLNNFKILESAKIVKAAFNGQSLVTYTTDKELYFYRIMADEAAFISLCSSKRQITTLMCLSQSQNILLVGDSYSLYIYTDFHNPRPRKFPLFDSKCVGLYELQLENTSLVLTAHRNHVVKVYNKDIKYLKDIHLRKSGHSLDAYFSNKCESYRFELLCPNKLMISHGRHLTMYKIVESQLAHQELQAHRSDIKSIKVYREDPEQAEYVVTMCDSAVRLWRPNPTTGLQLVGEVAVSNVVLLVPVGGVGLYLAGRCYNSGLVLWREASSFISRQLRNSRRF